MAADMNMNTPDIIVTAVPKFLPEHSDMQDDDYVFAYRIRIVNRCGQTVTLKRRHWQITDALGRVDEVNGEGVVGETPTLADGDDFDYTSSARLTTPWGDMVGHYEFETLSGECFKVPIPRFELRAQVTLH